VGVGVEGKYVVCVSEPVIAVQIDGVQVWQSIAARWKPQQPVVYGNLGVCNLEVLQSGRQELGWRWHDVRPMESRGTERLWYGIFRDRSIRNCWNTAPGVT
jgi:hypothetical protein